MKELLFVATIVSGFFSTTFSQSNIEYRDDQLDYYTWFHEHSNTADLYQSGKIIYTFVDHALVHQEACVESRILADLPVGTPITNLFDETIEPTWESINGYNDIWYKVKGFDRDGNHFVGYLWGGHIAKAYQPAFVTGEGVEEFILLGVSSKKRKGLRDINAELKVVSENKVISKATIPGMCLFEECTSDALVRILTDQPFKGEIIIEASSMTISCVTGIEKSYFSWKNGQLELVYQFSTPNKKETIKKSFSYDFPEETILCRYSHETADFTPVWKCKRIKKHKTRA